MIEFFFGSIWSVIGTTTAIVLACVAVAWFFPPLRTYAIELAAVVLAAASIYTKGNRDEARKWTDAEKAMVAKAKQARADARRDVAAPDGMRDDKFNRDRG